MGQKASWGWLQWPGPAATQLRPAWLRVHDVNVPVTVTMRGALIVAWSLAAARLERRDEVWRWGIGIEGRWRRAGYL
jgi:hypothetical protein